MLNKALWADFIEFYRCKNITQFTLFVNFQNSQSNLYFSSHFVTKSVHLLVYYYIY